jgi:hypothetical protein
MSVSNITVENIVHTFSTGLLFQTLEPVRQGKKQANYVSHWRSSCLISNGGLRIRNMFVRLQVLTAASMEMIAF